MKPIQTTPRPAGLRTVVRLTLLLLVSATASACRDVEGGDPLAVVLTEETRGALALDVDLPSLPGIVARSPEPSNLGAAGSADGWAGRWEASWLMDPPGGREARSAVYDEAMDRLARELGPEGVESVLTSVEEASNAAASASLMELPPLYRARVEEAHELVDWGWESLEDGASAEALRAALEAADRLRTVSPHSVAELLLTRARRATDDLAGRTKQERERIHRLVRGAESALEDGDYRRAIHRAFYACQLLDVGLP